MEDRGKNRFLIDLDGFSRRVAYFGRLNALAQVLLKLTCPGVPDIYQGTEIVGPQPGGPGQPEAGGL